MKDNMESIFVHRSWSSRCRQLEIGGWTVNLWERTSNEDYKPSDEEGKKSSPNYRRKIGCSFLVSILHENLVGPRFQPKRVSPIRKDLQDYTSAALQISNLPLWTIFGKKTNFNLYAVGLNLRGANEASRRFQLSKAELTTPSIS